MRSPVEDLLRNKPAAKPLATPSFLDFSLPSINLGGGGGGAATTNSSSSSALAGAASASASGGAGGGGAASKFDMFTRKFKETMVDLINTDLSQPYETGPGSGGRPGGAGGGAGSPQLRAGTPTQQQQLPQRAATPGAPGAPPSASPQQQQQQQQRPAQASPAPQQPRDAPSPSPAGAEAAPPSPAAGSPSPSPSPSQAQQGGRWGLRERTVAIESLTAIADELKAARGALTSLLGGGAASASGGGLGSGSGGGGGAGGAALAREVELYYSRTVDAGMFDSDRGTAAQIAAAGYASREPAANYQPWSEALLRHMRSFGQFVAAAGLPGDIQKQMWEHAARLAADAVLDGLARCRRCSVEGRAAMSLDFGYVEKGLRGLLPAGASAGSSLRLLDAYIKAFYMPWEELPRWSQVHLAEYGKAKILALIETMAEAYGVKRAAKTALLERLNAELDEFA
ncbi:hypothetical protein MNEG_9136 [Monoraphidium neglectum]|uniref:Syndetin C-terminal domain-containing protein n=1 Tax=Monoraphidium neglectum TaxID=145388 RepID=A0A0D2JHH1_9CHLO|nr:hypothetical protein MNEG_9136 [Monoraphidium neglectum]KIY98822.1 hypothetical protein MNEG_9136 [Monoraphidium neglectum]|eukprot:XP_013897842.1 hypothetical protein MNEG_9136 [Monoraphidium neglectum]